MLERKLKDERNEMAILWSEPETNLPNNYSSSLGQLNFNHFSKDSELTKNQRVCIKSQ